MANFSDRELSLHDSKPIELYLFSNGDKTWTVTSADQPISFYLSFFTPSATKIFKNSSDNPQYYGELTFTPLAIQRTETANTQELNRAYINITVPSDFGVARLHLNYPPSSITAVTVFRYHRNTAVNIEPFDNNNLVTEFLGRVVNVTGVGVSSELRCEPITTSIKRIGLTQMYQRQCPHTLYDMTYGACRVPKASYANNRVIADVEGLVFTFTTTLVEPGKPLGYYNGGMITWKSGNYIYWRWILNQPLEGVINVNFPVPEFDADGEKPIDLENPPTMTLYPGCAHTMSDCRDKFNNLLNYGGMPYIPFLNPFNGSTLY